MFEKDIEKLISQHREMNKILKNFEKKLENFTLNDAKQLLNFVLTYIENHAKEEDEIFLPKVLNIYPDYDAEAFSFAHQTIREETEYLSQAIDEVIKGKKKESVLKNFAKKLITTIYDHFLEEENFFFPDIKRIKISNSKAYLEEIDLKEEKEWL